MSMLNTPSVPPLPERLIVGYANWHQSDELIVRAVQHGVNVVIWFAVDLSISEDSQKPCVRKGPNMDEVALRVREMRAQGHTHVIHLISIGGWNAPHPDTTHDAESVFSAWHEWNTRIAARPALGFEGFHGFDWDIEGNDDPLSPHNAFTVEALDLMGKMSQLAKRRGYVVSMAPAESYLDCSRPFFDRSLLHEYDEWRERIPRFAYHGMNTYAYLLARYGRVSVPSHNNHAVTHTDTHTDNTETETEVETFDFVTVQLYEGYSHAQYQCVVAMRPPQEVLSQFVRDIVRGCEIDFSTDAELRFPEKRHIAVAPQRLVVGLANGWAGDGKFLLVYPDEVQKAYEQLQSEGLAPRGFAFWNILDEGRASPLRPEQPVWMAQGLNRFLDTHPHSHAQQEEVCSVDEHKQ